MLVNFLNTLKFMTILPLPESHEGSAPKLVMLPLAGLFIGSILFSLQWLSPLLPPLAFALLVTLIWLGITGFLHLDGLADLTDGLMASHQDKAKLLAVMKEPHIGAFGATAIILAVLSKFILIYSAISAELWVALLLIPAWSRLGAAYWTDTLPALSDGMAAWIKSAGQSHHLMWGAILIFLSFILAPILILAPIALFFWQHFLHKKLGGMNGDCLGAGIEVCEIALLFLCSLQL